MQKKTFLLNIVQKIFLSTFKTLPYTLEFRKKNIYVNIIQSFRCSLFRGYYIKWLARMSCARVNNRFKKWADFIHIRP